MITLAFPLTQNPWASNLRPPFPPPPQMSFFTSLSTQVRNCRWNKKSKLESSQPVTLWRLQIASRSTSKIDLNSQKSWMKVSDFKVPSLRRRSQEVISKLKSDWHRAGSVWWRKNCLFRFYQSTSSMENWKVKYLSDSNSGLKRKITWMRRWVWSYFPQTPTPLFEGNFLLNLLTIHPPLH